MKDKSHEVELGRANAPEWVYPIIEDLFEEYFKEGHSGGSHGIMIGWMRGWLKELTPITDPDSLLTPLSTILFRLGIEEDRKLVLDYFIKLANQECLSPLTGEEDEWVYHDFDRGTAQNKRMGSVFKDMDTGDVRWLDGRVFCELSDYNTNWLGWGGYYSSTPVTFPWTKPPVEKVYYIDHHREIGLPQGTDPELYATSHFFKICAGVEKGAYINPYSFFIKPEDKEELLYSFYKIVKRTPDFTLANKKKLLKELNALTWSDEEHDDPELVLEMRHDYAGLSVFKRLVMPLLRLFACVPESATISPEGVICGYRNSIWEPEFQVPYIPTKRFQDWQPMTKRYAGHLSVRLNQNSGVASHYARKSKEGEINKSYFDLVGYEIRYVNDEDYLYSMRRRFNIKHPKVKDRPRGPNDPCCDNAG